MTGAIEDLGHERRAAQPRLGASLPIAGLARPRFLPLGPLAHGAARPLSARGGAGAHATLVRAPGRPRRRRARRAGTRGRQDAAAAGAARPAGRGPADDRQGAGVPGDGAPGLRRARHGRGFASTGAGVGEAAVGGQQIYAHVSVRPVGVRPAVPGQHDRQPDPHHPPLCRARAPGALPAGAVGGGLREPAAGRHVHDRALRRLRRGRDGDARRAAVGNRATIGCSPATSGSAPTPTPTWRWCWRGRKGHPILRNRAPPVSACS